MLESTISLEIIYIIKKYYRSILNFVAKEYFLYCFNISSIIFGNNKSKNIKCFALGLKDGISNIFGEIDTLLRRNEMKGIVLLEDQVQDYIH